jgi:hypothetical protein
VVLGSSLRLAHTAFRAALCITVPKCFNKTVMFTCRDWWSRYRAVICKESSCRILRRQPVDLRRWRQDTAVSIQAGDKLGLNWFIIRWQLRAAQRHCNGALHVDAVHESARLPRIVTVRV